MKTVFLFPGQGSQSVGMGKDLYEAFPAAKAVFEQAEEVSKLPLRKLCFEGPEQELERTDVCQPAIFTVSAATLAVMQDLPAPRQRPQPTFAAGLSLGEYTALYAAGAMDLATATQLVACRGQAMRSAAAAAPSGMVSIMGLDKAKVRELCDAASCGETLTCANFNCPGQIVLSGAIEACRRAAELAPQFGAGGAVELKVAGAFHSEFMRPAAQKLTEALTKVSFKPPKLPVIANVDATAYDGADNIPEKLIAQLTCPVRWQQSMEYLLDQKVERFCEIGPGRVLAGLMRRIDRRIKVTCVNSRKAIEKLSQT